MAAPFRIEPSPRRRLLEHYGGRAMLTAMSVSVRPSRSIEFKFYLDKLVRMIPAEVISLYLVGSGLIPKNRTVLLIIWSLVCLLAVLVVRVYGTRNPLRNLPPQWGAVSISMGSFVVWLYAIGGPFAQFPAIYDPVLGSLLVLAWTFFIPYVYEPKSVPLSDDEYHDLEQEWMSEEPNTNEKS